MDKNRNGYKTKFFLSKRFLSILKLLKSPVLEPILLFRVYTVTTRDLYRPIRASSLAGEAGYTVGPTLKTF